MRQIICETTPNALSIQKSTTELGTIARVVDKFYSHSVDTFLITPVEQNIKVKNVESAKKILATKLGANSCLLPSKNKPTKNARPYTYYHGRPSPSHSHLQIFPYDFHRIW